MDFCCTFFTLFLLILVLERMFHDHQLPRFSLSCINCNSLNSSNTSSLHHKLKMYGIAKLKTDIIFLSDLRLSNSNISVSNQISNTFQCNPYGNYKFFYNSSKSNRGVGILINNSIDFAVVEEQRDGNCNILGLVVRKKVNFFISYQFMAQISPVMNFL
jgi:hypothetical protein